MIHILGHVQINHVNSRDVRLRVHRGSEMASRVRPGSAVYEVHNSASPQTANAASNAAHEQVGR